MVEERKEMKPTRASRADGPHALRALTVALLCGLSMLVAPAPAAASGWFWKEVPAKASGGSRAKSLAVVRAANGRGVGRFGSAAKARSVAARWRNEIDQAARRARVSEALLVAIVMVESGGNHRAVSPAGAHGLAQLMPGTARRYGVGNRFDPAQNLRGGAAYLSDLLNMFEGDLVFALAAYNAGENAVLRHGGVPPYAETRAYVPRVLSAFLTASKLCRQPPRNPRRRCALPRPRN